MKLIIIGITTAVSALLFIITQRMKFNEAESAKEKFFALDGLFKLHGALNNVDWRWLKAISKQESDLGRDPRTIRGNVSSDGKSYGVMQIAEKIGSPKEIELKGFGGKTKLNDPNYSIGQAAKLVSYLNNKYNNQYKVFLAYNQGERNTDNGRNYTHNYPEKIINHLDWISRKEKEYSV